MSTASLTKTLSWFERTNEICPVKGWSLGSYACGTSWSVIGRKGQWNWNHGKLETPHETHGQLRTGLFWPSSDKSPCSSLYKYLQTFVPLDLPMVSPVVPRAEVLLLSQTWMVPLFSCNSDHPRFPFWLAELSVITACARHAQQCWRYQSNTPSAWEAYHYQLRRCRSSGNFNQQRHFHIQRDKDIINSLKWAPEGMSCSSWDTFFLHPVWNKLFHEMQQCCADLQLLMPWFSVTDILRKSNFSEGFSFPWGTCCLFLSLLQKAPFMMATWKSCTRTQQAAGA